MALAVVGLVWVARDRARLKSRCGRSPAIARADRAPAGRGRLALQDARRARPGRRLHRHGRRRGHRRWAARLHEPTDPRHPRLSTRGVHDRPGALAEPAPSGRPSRGAGRVRRALADRPAAPGRVPDDRPRRDRGLGPRRGVRDARGDDHRPIRVAGPASSTRPTASASRRSSSTTRSTIRSPVSPTGSCSAITSSARSPAGGAAGRASPCSSSTSTTSRSSTTRSATGR